MSNDFTYHACNALRRLDLIRCWGSSNYCEKTEAQAMVASDDWLPGEGRNSTVQMGDGCIKFAARGLPRNKDSLVERNDHSLERVAVQRIVFSCDVTYCIDKAPYVQHPPMRPRKKSHGRKTHAYVPQDSISRSPVAFSIAGTAYSASRLSSCLYRCLLLRSWAVWPRDWR